MPATPDPDTSLQEHRLSMRIAGEADVPAVRQLINAAFIVERPIFDNDRIDDGGVRGFLKRANSCCRKIPEGN